MMDEIADKNGLPVLPWEESGGIRLSGRVNDPSSLVLPHDHSCI